MGLDIYIKKMVVDRVDYKGEDIDEKFPEPVEVGYFRKVNFLMPEMANQLEIGAIENCERYIIEEEHLEDVVDKCKRVLEDHSLAEDLLPTQGGFCFGSTEYDEHYFDDVQDVLDTFTDILENVVPDMSEDQRLVFYVWY